MSRDCAISGCSPGWPDARTFFAGMAACRRHDWPKRGCVVHRARGTRLGSPV